MKIHKLFPCLLISCSASLFAASAPAQTNEPDGRQRSALTNSIPLRPIEAAPVTVPPTTIEERAPITAITNSPLLGLFHTSLTAAMEERVGAYYHYGSTGPAAFDCSGFVWSSFQAAGVNFERGPARSYWATFAPPARNEEFKFGTLVFFSGLTHIGIVVDEHGFYHSSRHNGVIYSPFNDYWLSRIDGFRRVPLDSMQAVVLNEKARTAKPTINTQTDDDANGP